MKINTSRDMLLTPRNYSQDTLHLVMRNTFCRHAPLVLYIKRLSLWS